jgi:hypothetical protein
MSEPLNLNRHVAFDRKAEKLLAMAERHFTAGQTELAVSCLKGASRMREEAEDWEPLFLTEKGKAMAATLESTLARNDLTRAV